MDVGKLVDTLNTWVWSDWLVYLCLGAGLYFTIRLRLVQVRHIPGMLEQLKRGSTSDSGVSSFQALAMSLAGRIGVGNIAGVATAIAFGGPGAVFWMWVVAFLGAATSFIECALGQVYKEKDDKGEYRGGPAYFIEKAYKHTKFGGFFKVYAIVFALVTAIAMGFLLPGVQANNLGQSAATAWGVNLHVVGIVTALLLGLIIIGGVKRIGTFAAMVVPFMAALYILFAVVVLVVNIQIVPDMLALIISSAFGADELFGAIFGHAVMWGVKRGIYSNEAGQGTGPHAAAAAEVSHPAKQGLAQSFAVYIDTLFVCTATAIMILSTDMYRVHEGGNGDGAVIFTGHEQVADVEVGPAFTQAALDTVWNGFGATFVAVAVFFFAFTTIVAYYYMAETNLTYVLRSTNRTVRRVAIIVLQVVALFVVYNGTVVDGGHAWALGDIGVGMMAWLNIVAILIIQVPAVKVLKDYERQKKEGLDPQFDPRPLGIRNATFWEERADALAAGASQSQLESRDLGRDNPDLR